MNAAEIYAERLTRYRARPGFSLSQVKYGLWLAEDHILQITRGPYRETYRRFYFRDIQALSLTRTRTHQMLMGVAALGAVMLLGGLLVMGLYLTNISGDADPGNVVFGAVVIMAGFAAVVAGFPGFLGPTCVCMVTTPIQHARLDALCRWKRDLPTFEALCEKVAAVQGTLSEEVAAQLEAPKEVVPPERQAIAPPRVEPGNWHMLLYGLLLVDAVHSAAVLTVPNRALDVIGLFLGISIITSAILALTVQRRSTVPRPLRNLTAGATAYVMVIFLIALTVGSFVAGMGGITQRAASPRRRCGQPRGGPEVCQC
jgi:uncharacterized membrane protein HdeD (DUF308 family)